MIESDSQVLVQMVLGKAEIPWKLRRVLGEIWELLGALPFQFKHVYRESNVVADFLASFAVHTGRCHEFFANDFLPVAGRLLLQRDQGMLPTTRKKRVIVFDKRNGAG